MSTVPWAFGAASLLGLGLQLESIALILAAVCLTWGATLEVMAS